MFTGIVETTGRIGEVTDGPEGRRVRIEAPAIAADFDPGDSVSVSGVCLTVERRTDSDFEVFLSRETVERTTLGDVSTGSLVNLERPMPADGRFDGHLVQGHVDGTATITAIEREGDDWRFSFAIPSSYDRYIVEKGSITIDGISLTVAHRDATTFDVAIIPATYEITTLSEKSVGDPVHVEVDVIAKYVESMLHEESQPQAASHQFADE